MMGGGKSAMMGANSAPCPESSDVGPLRVAVAGFRFYPQGLDVSEGTTVTWTHDDNVPHTVTARDRSQFDLGTLPQAASWTHRFDEAGAYAYFCEFHPWMTADVHVAG